MAQLNHITPEQVAQYGVVAAPDVLKGKPADNKAVFDRLVRELVANVVNQIIDQTNLLMEAEDIRVQQESARVAAEAARVLAEKAREHAENLRVLAEAGRASDEDARKAAENARTDAEVKRAAAEVLRVQAEQARADEHTGLVAQATAQATSAANSAQNAAGSAAAALRSEETVERRANEIVQSASKQAESFARGGTGSRPGEDTDNARYYCEKAREIAGAEYALKTEAQGYVDTHNSAQDAHAALFEAVAAQAAAAIGVVQTNLTNHENDKNNSHGVTAEQIGAATEQYVDGAVSNAMAIRKTLPVAAGQTIAAGDVVDVVNGEAKKNVVPVTNSKNVLHDTRSKVYDAIKLSETYSVAAWWYSSNDYNDDYARAILIDNTTGSAVGNVANFYVANTDSVIDIRLVRLSDTKLVVAYIESNAVRFKVGTVSGTSISFGPEVNLGITSNRNGTIIPLSESQFIYTWSVTSTPILAASVFSVSGTTVSIEKNKGVSVYAAQQSSTRLPDENGNRRVCVCYLDGNNSSYPTAMVITIASDNSLTFGTPAIIDTTGKSMPTCCTDTDGNVIVFYGGRYLKVLTISGTSITPAPTSLDIGPNGNRQNILMVGNKIVGVWHDGSGSRSYASVFARNGLILTKKNAISVVEWIWR